MKTDGLNAGLTGLTGELQADQGGKVIAGITNLTAKSGSDKDTDGTFNITVGDTKRINLPLTGLNGVTFTWIAGSAVPCVGVAHPIRRCKHDDGSEE